MSRQVPYSHPVIWPGQLCECCEQAPATQILARRKGQVLAARLVSKPIAPHVVLCHFCWLTILWGLKPIPGEIPGT
jgi:hypothetical protein